MKYSHLIAMLPFVLVGCQAAPPYQPEPPQQQRQEPPETFTPYPLSNTQIKTIEDKVRSSLKDPTSPIFGGVAAAKSNKGLVNVCGIVNAKNSYGGYTGDQPYFGALAGKEPNQIFVVIGFGGTDSERYAVTEMCRRAGIGG